jgi:hypothetical protein
VSSHFGFEPPKKLSRSLSFSSSPFILCEKHRNLLSFPRKNVEQSKEERKQFSERKSESKRNWLFDGLLDLKRDLKVKF